MLQNMAKNLQRLDFSSLGQMQGALNRIGGLMMQAKGLSFDLTQLEGQWRQQYPDSYYASIGVNDMATAARERLPTAISAFRKTMREIGRAPCRARVFHYVTILVFADTLTKK